MAVPRSRAPSVSTNDSRRDSGYDKNADSTAPSLKVFEILGALPQDPSDPEAVAETTILAFGASERYFVCWRTQGGVYRQESNNLPSALREWLYPTDGSSRHFPSLNVVFGRGDEFWASDKDGKIDSKDIETRSPSPTPQVPSTEATPARHMSRQSAHERALAMVKAKGQGTEPTTQPTRPSLQGAIRRARTLSLVRPSPPAPVDSSPLQNSTQMSPLTEMTPTVDKTTIPLSFNPPRNRLSWQSNQSRRRTITLDTDIPRSTLYNLKTPEGSPTDRNSPKVEARPRCSMSFHIVSSITPCSPKRKRADSDPQSTRRKHQYVDSGYQAYIPPRPQYTDSTTQYESPVSEEQPPQRQYVDSGYQPEPSPPAPQSDNSRAPVETPKPDYVDSGYQPEPPLQKSQYTNPPLQTDTANSSIASKQSSIADSSSQADPHAPIPSAALPSKRPQIDQSTQVDFPAPLSILSDPAPHSKTFEPSNRTSDYYSSTSSTHPWSAAASSYAAPSAYGSGCDEGREMMQAPVIIGGMSSYFGSGNYQLGDSLSFGYQQKPVYWEYYEDEGLQ